ncbi:MULTISPECIES: hypothetical protein [unclassified Bradyrhizobium]|uniref:hypothetical protein n=1 Tax=unclassified Bradyrhizobium TaxID=2631580 RepID=UPI001FFB8CDD|nr:MULTISPECIES: hypothetical protein [unclassified Bradyrhizobium]
MANLINGEPIAEGIHDEIEILMLKQPLVKSKQWLISKDKATSLGDTPLDKNELYR